MKKRVICLLFGILLLLTGCVNEMKDEYPTDTTMVSESESEGESIESVEQFFLIKGGKTQYIIVCENSDYTTIAENLNRGLQDKTGISFTLRRFKPEGIGQKIIYVGYDYNDVVNPETKTLIGTYGVVEKDENLYLCFDTLSGGSQCVAEFLAMISSKTVSKNEYGETQVAITKEQFFLHEAEPNPFAGTLLGAPLGEYRIVIPSIASDVEKYFAEELSNAIVSYAKLEIPIVKDSTAPVGREIVVGKTTRAGSDVFYDSEPAPYSYCIKGNGNNIYIGYSSDFCLYLATNRFKSLLTKDNDSIDIEDSTTVLSDVVERERETDVRIMTSNILFVGYDNSDPNREKYKSRMYMTAEFYNLHMPDFIGLQECADVMKKALEPHLSEVYAWVDFESDAADNVFYPILYDSSKWEVVESGYNESANESAQTWGYVWATFSRIDDPNDRYTLVNLHYSFMSEHPLRLQLAEKVNTFIKAELERYPDKPIAVTGDYNASVGSDVFEAQIKDISMNTAFLLTDNINMGGQIDHICVTYDIAEVVCFRGFLYSGQAMSDHPYYFADIRKKSAENNN